MHYVLHHSPHSFKLFFVIDISEYLFGMEINVLKWNENAEFPAHFQWIMRLI